MKAGKLVGIGLLGVLLCGPVLAAESISGGPTKPRAGSEETSSFNLAKLSAEAHVVYVSSGWLPLARQMIDGNAATAFSFSTTDFHPTVVVELAQAQRLRRVTAICDLEGRLDIYLLTKFSGDAADVLKGKPIASIASSAGDKAAVDFEPRGARYVVLRWTRKKPVTGASKVAEVGAFSVGSNSVFDLVEPPSFVHSTIHMTTNGSPDFSNTLGTLANPPTVPPVSPTVPPVSP
jgi:hypothetical protein